MDQNFAASVEQALAGLFNAGINPEQTQQYMNMLSECREHSEVHFIVILANLLADATKSEMLRYQAGMQLKNCLSSKDPEVLQELYDRWITYDESVRMQVKNQVSSTLSVPTVSKAAAQCISAILVAESSPTMPMQADFVNYLSETSRSGADLNSRLTCLEALGYLCEELYDAERQDCISEASVNDILSALHANVVDPPSILARRNAIRALGFVIMCMGKNMQDKTECDQIVGIIVQCAELADPAESEARIYGLEALSKWVNEYYELSTPYMDNFFHVTLTAMTSPDVEDGVVQQGIEFWAGVCENESSIKQHNEDCVASGMPQNCSQFNGYAVGAVPRIFPVVLNLLMRLDDEEQDLSADDDYNIHSAASVCVEAFASAAPDAVLDPTFTFVNDNMRSPLWQGRNAALLAFGSILEGPKSMESLCFQIIPELAYAVSSQEPTLAVRDTAAWTIGRVAELYGASLLGHEQFNEILQHLFQCLSLHPVLANHACYAFHTINEAAYAQADVVDEADPPTYALSPFFADLVNQLLVVSNAREHAGQDVSGDAYSKLEASAFECLSEVVQESPQDCLPAVRDLGVQLYHQLTGQLQSAASIVNVDDSIRFSERVTYLAQTITYVLNRLDPASLGDLGTNVYNLAINMVHQNVLNTREDALYLLIALIQAYQSDLPRQVVPQLNEVMNLCFADLSDHEMVKLALSMFGDLCRSIATDVAPFANDWIAMIQQLLASEQVHFSVKPQLFCTLGDIAIALGPNFAPFLPSTFQILIEAFGITQTSLASVPDAEYATVQPLQEMLEGIIESLVGIIQGFKGIKKVADPSIHQLIPYGEFILKVVQDVSKLREVSRTDGMVKGIVGMIGDLCHGFSASTGIDAAAFFRADPPTMRMIEYGERSANTDTQRLSKWARKCVLRPTR
ncbi:hypothetical protein CAOG_04675 [Capsaspora owczarzaki ATCC 30864]|uniref:Importin N-terminal domain-containing protein n=1 Tax=Capsaspora owczarzaki (strain ATCC 30864) TaxID=595528 RepID=A0A0D2UFQ5_CAPO3|nr:hypothetical protein CAOG_04675 [Capsaspora owczarzaki ATCC 30864]KJE93966.1 hypothetical protein CAOG_004675 [Capsaspora owczarzaki ATCC 30864]|eukprot:XP_004347422.1 hypothetical protein CAOG_04675 [Capsaspora owczarzaki ATCC 30864]